MENKYNISRKSGFIMFERILPMVVKTRSYRILTNCKFKYFIIARLFFSHE